jgi:hypothetical protein
VAEERETTTAVPAIEYYRDRAVKLVMGDSWSYAELESMPSWKQTVDAVASALLDERRAGLIAPAEARSE